MSEYTITFKKNADIWKLYQRLKKAGVKDADLDKGYPKTDYVKKKRSVIHKGDRKIQKQEVLNYALENYQRYQLAIKKTTGYVVPWSLDDLDPKTDFDKKLRVRITKAINRFKGILTRAGYKKGTDKYNELLAVSLYAFAMAKKVKGANKTLVPADAAKEIMDAKLFGVRSYLKANGGLERIFIKDDCSMEATAVEALRDKCGWCTEQSKVLSAIFKRAGLKTDFVYGKFIDAARKKHQIAPASLHTSVALVLSDRVRFFDANMKKADAEQFYKGIFEWWYRQTSRELLSVHYSNLGNTYARKAEPEKAIAGLKTAIGIDPDHAAGYCNLGKVYLSNDKLDLAITKYKEAVKIDPTFVVARLGLGNAYYAKGEIDRAIAEYNMMIKINPKDPRALNNLRLAYEKKAEPYYNRGIAYAKKGLELSEKGQKQEALKENKKALLELQKAAKIGMPNLDEVISVIQGRIK